MVERPRSQRTTSKRDVTLNFFVVGKRLPSYTRVRKYAHPRREHLASGEIADFHVRPPRGLHVIAVDHCGDARTN